MLHLIFFVMLHLLKCINCAWCYGENGHQICCAGFFLNLDTGHCDECPVGYFGLNCLRKCSFPTYGKECQMDCQCSENLCDFSHGCQQQLESENSIKSTTQIKYSETEDEILVTGGTLYISKSIPETTQNNSNIDKNSDVNAVLIALSMLFCIVCVFTCIFKTSLCRCKQNFGTNTQSTKSTEIHLEMAQIKEETHNEVEGAIHDEEMYLCPVFENMSMYEDIDALNSPDRISKDVVTNKIAPILDEKDGLSFFNEENIYLTPS